MTKRVIVIGAGIGGLTTAAILAKAGMDVHVLEAHVYAGGCAGTFFHKGYRFDAGATLSGGFYAGGPMDLVAKATGIQQWPAVKTDEAMVVHLPDSTQVTRWGDTRRFEEYEKTLGPRANEFWSWQESTADALWDLALSMPSWPPQTPLQWINLISKGVRWLGKDFKGRLSSGLLADAFRPVSDHLKGQSDQLRLFVDAQLLISAQTTSQYANALYGASALDLPRRGVVHLEGGMGAIADTLVKAVRANGGKVTFRKEVTKIDVQHGKPMGVHLKRGEVFPADLVIANLTPWNLNQLLDGDKPSRLSNLSPEPDRGWGAFMVYAGVDKSVIPEEFPLHHQLILGEPMGEGNTVFVSISPVWDTLRAPEGKRAITISTHTDFRPWWRLYQQDTEGYELRKQEYAQRLTQAVERIIPGMREASELIMPGTPLSFTRFTGRAWGWVGGFPQTSLFNAWGPRILPGLWMVGDSIFPGQSTAAVALGGMRIAEDVIRAESRQVFRSRQSLMHTARNSG